MARVVVDGEIRNAAGVVRCPACRRTCGLTVYGTSRARLKCPCGEDFAPEPHINPVQLLRDVTAAAR